MSLPLTNLIEMPILQELAATGGADELHYLYMRLIGYFPQLDEAEVSEIKAGVNKNWRKAVQKAGRSLDESNFIKRNRGLWTITQKGLETARNESLNFTVSAAETDEPLTHQKIQQLLVEIGVFLGFSAETEFQYYDVVWRETPNSQRLSHIFEVQSKGNIDSAFAKLKRAYQSQRTQPFLILTSERDTNRAEKSLAREFQEIESVLTIITFVQVEKIHRNLKALADILPKLLKV